jgi:hypothetical protein
MIVREWIGKNFKDALIIALLIILLVKIFGHSTSGEPTITIVRDTVYIHHDSTVYSKPVIYKSIVPRIQDLPPVIVPDSQSCTFVIDEYNKLRVKYLTQNIYRDTLKIDSIGQVRIEDTIQNNTLLARKYSYNFRERVITNTVTITNPPKRQLYYGLSIGATQYGVIDNAGLGVLYKNRNDRIIGLNIGYNIEQKSPQYTLSFYSKLKLRKVAVHNIALK